jgi:anti-anti-sigma factor
VSIRTDGHAFHFGIANSSLVLFADGELDTDAAGDLLERLDPMRGRHLSLDLGAVTFIDASTLCVLVTVHRRQERAGGSMTLVNVQPSHLRLLRLTGLTEVLRIELPLDADASAAASSSAPAAGQ